MAKRRTSQKNSRNSTSNGRPRRSAAAPAQKPIEQYEHSDKTRLNNPPVGLVTPETEPARAEAKRYAHDPHLDPQLVWAGRAEHTSFEVPTVSLHVHERIDARTIIEAVRARSEHEPQPTQPSLFEQPSQNLPLRDAIDFYKHAHGWSNRLIAGDSLLVMNSLLEKEGMGGQVQMVFIDPPYGIKYGSNFQPFVNKRDVKDGKDEDLTQEPETIRAFRDTWELGIHSYLTYLRDRLLLAREILHESGSIFVQISDENLHHIRELLDEVFGHENFVSVITFQKTTGQTSGLLPGVADYLLWYCRDRARVKYRQLFTPKVVGREGTGEYVWLKLSDGSERTMTAEEREDPSRIPEKAKVFRHDSMVSQGFRQNTTVTYMFEGKEHHPGPTNNWKTTPDGLDRLALAGRLVSSGRILKYKRYIDDFPVFPIANVWSDTTTGGSSTDPRLYIVQTVARVIQRCMLMVTDPGDLVFDPTCGSGSTAFVAEQWGRRWITCDTSRVALTLAKQRLMGAVFDYYQLARPEEGVGSGFRYKTVPHTTLKSIANNPEIRHGMPQRQVEAAVTKYAEQEVLYDKPHVENDRVRVSGPFTVEAVPAPSVRALDDIEEDASPTPVDASIARFGSTLRHSDWRSELLKTGIRGRSGQKIEFSRVEPLGGTRWLHADAETKGVKPERVVVSFGPEHAPLEQRQVELAWEEARTLSPKPSIIVFAAFEFDPEAAKDIDELTPEKTKMTFLTAKMNGDLLTEDLKKKRSSNESFWLVGRPDVDARPFKTGEHKGKWQVEILGFDYFNTRTGRIESGDTSKIAMWLLDIDYDGRSLFPRQVFFPMAGENDGWARLARNLKGEIDSDLIETYRGTVSLPFLVGKNRRVAIKVVDDRGIESLKIVGLR